MRSDMQYRCLIIWRYWYEILEECAKNSERYSIFGLQVLLHEQKHAFFSAAPIDINAEGMNRFVIDCNNKNILPKDECKTIQLAVDTLERQLLAPYPTPLKMISFALTTQTPFVIGYHAYRDQSKPGLDARWSEIGSVFVGVMMLAIQWNVYYSNGINSLFIMNGLQLLFERSISALLLTHYDISGLTRYKKISPCIHFVLPLFITKTFALSESNTFNQFFSLYLLLKFSQVITGKIINYFLPAKKNNALCFFVQTAVTLATCLFLFPYLYNRVFEYFFTNALASRDSALLTSDPAAFSSATCREMRKSYREAMRKTVSLGEKFDPELVALGSTLRSCGK